ncbi:MAG: zinc-binding dehydrogenase [Alphaproteobacteria bacterium]
MTESIPRTMKAVVTRGHGGFEMLDYTEVPTPVPAAGEVLIRVTACGLNNTDVWSREGRYGTDRDPEAQTAAGRVPGTWPRIQGCDIVGRIAAVGPAVPPSRIGERVLCNFVIYGDSPSTLGFVGSLGSSRDGGYAEYTTLPAENAHAVGDIAMSDAELATFPCAYITAEHMLDAAGVAKGERVLVTGASGGAGSAIVQLAQARGAETIAVTSAPWLERVRELGPTYAIARDGGNLHDMVRQAIGQRAVDAAADVVGGPLFTDILALLRPGGRYVTAGAIGGAVVPFDIRTIYLKRLTLYGVSIGYAKHFAALLGYIRAGRVKPLLAATFPLARFRDAQALFVSKSFFGNIVVLPTTG